MTDGCFQRQPGFDLHTYWSEWCAQFEAGQTTYRVTVLVSNAGIPLLVHAFGEGISSFIGKRREKRVV